MQVGDNKTDHYSDDFQKYDPDLDLANETEDSEEEMDKAQFGVRAAVASLEVWTKRNIYIAYVL